MTPDEGPRSMGELAQMACIWEVMARKMGNVHPRASFCGTTATDFLLSAVAIHSAMTEACSLGIGQTIYRAVAATQSVVHQNTNLGICLIVAPLAAVALDESLTPPTMRRVLDCLTRDDTEWVYRAIRLAQPGGLGDVPEQDVHVLPTVPLREAMQLAADRDMIARQYVHGFADVLEFGVPKLCEAFQRLGSLEAAIIDCQLAWMATFSDSLIARKNGLAIAEDVRLRARDVQSRGGITTSDGRVAAHALDRFLRSDGNKLNPGTTADLIAACLFVALREKMIAPSALFHWPIEDWL
ncbi:MAG: triphosphoribosyl-dephospho-CoA synthase [Bacteroidales bacterium]|nr:triphosphoribosyl-dephospho-CoA synthase [Bacteroidales bacterium]